MATMLVSINSSWNFVNFRAGLIGDWLRAGHRVVAAAPRDAHTDQLIAMGCEHRDIPLDPRSTSPLADARLFAAYLRIFAETRPDVFLGYTIKPNIYGSLAAGLFRVPVINNITGLGIGFARRGGVQRLIRRLYRVALRRSSTVFFQNDADLTLFRDARLAPVDALRLVPGSGVDLSHFAPARVGSPGSATTFLMISRILRSKGVIEYAEAAAIVAKRHPGVRFLLLGAGGEGHADGVDAGVVNGWATAGGVVALGTRDDVRPIIAEADCVVLPSYSEGLARSLLEAAAMAKPLIASDIPGCRAVARPDRNAMLVPPVDAAALAEAFEAFLALSPAARAAMGEESRAIVEAEFDEQLVIAAYRAALARATARRLSWPRGV